MGKQDIQAARDSRRKPRPAEVRAELTRRRLARLIEEPVVSEGVVPLNAGFFVMHRARIAAGMRAAAKKKKA